MIADHNAGIDTGDADPPDADERELVRIINDYRLAFDLVPLEIDARLTASARGHSREMAELDYFGHESPVAGHRRLSDRTHRAGYPSQTVGECIWRGGERRVRAARIFDTWYTSSSHHRLMLSTSYHQIGVGRFDSHFTANFGGGWQFRR